MATSGATTPLRELLAGQEKVQAESTRVIALLFFAGWCPECEETVPPLLEALRAAEGSDAVTMVMVTSEERTDEMEAFGAANPGLYDAERMDMVPFEDDALRTTLKRRYQTCAADEYNVTLGKEGEEQVERLRGIPSIIVVDKETDEVLTVDGCQDLKDKGADVFAHWASLVA